MVNNRPQTVERDDDALFVKDGVPVKFCFHRSVTQGVREITRNVERHGGKIIRNERETDVLLVDEEQDIEFIRRRYYSSTELWRHEVYVEPRGFVQHCIRSGEYGHFGPVRQGMPGPTPGRGRVPFTEEDKDHLAYYLATRFPLRDGRLGQNAYKELVRLGQTDDPSWEWARRHTFHSWREHYKMNQPSMNDRINHYLERLKDVGHHFGHDPRRHKHWHLRQEEEEEEEEEEEQQVGREEQNDERREQEEVRQGDAAAGQAREYLTRHEPNLEVFGDDEGEGVQGEGEEEVVIQKQRHAKRHRVHPDAHHQRDLRKVQPKRARVSEASVHERRASGDDAGRGKDIPVRENDGDSEASEEIEGDDLFGDRTYGSEPRFEFNDDLEIEYPIPFSPRASPVPGLDVAPPSTQATLIASPRAAENEKERESSPAPVPGPTPTKLLAVERQVPALDLTVPSRSQRTVVPVIPRARVRGPSTQPGPSVSKETRSRGGDPALEDAVAEAPYRNTRVRSRSVEPPPQPTRQQKGRGPRGKGKAREEGLVPIEEDANAHIDVEEEAKETYVEKDEEVAVVVTGGLSTRETFEDEMAVEGLLEASVISGVDEGEGGEESDEVVQVKDEDEDDIDDDGMPDLPPYQYIDVDEPTDSDDAETHGSLVRGTVREGSVAEVDVASEQHQSQDEHENQDEHEESDEDDEDEDADRIERMARGSLHGAPAPAPTPFQPRVTRSQTRTQTQVQMQTQVFPQASPRRLRSGSQAHEKPPRTTFPSPGTKVRVAVDRFQEEEGSVPYEPPAGSRAAKVVKKRHG